MVEQRRMQEPSIQQVLSRQKRAALGMAMALLAIMVGAHCAIACTYSSTDYFVFTPGQGIKYRVTDNERGLSYSTWATAQAAGEGGFAFTFTESSNAGASSRNAWLGGSFSYDRGLYLFDAGCPSDNEHDLYALFTLPEVFDSGSAWSHFGRDYTVAFIGPYTLNSITFNDCIRVTVDNSQDSDDTMSGTGTYVVAQNIGIIEFLFTRTSGAQLRFEYIEHGEQQSRSICGTFSGLPDGGAVGELVVQLSDCDGSVRSLVNGRGQFTMSFFGEQAVLRAGYDHDGNGVFDPEHYPDYPKLYVVDCLTGAVTAPGTGLDLQVRSSTGCENTDSDGDTIPDGEDNCLLIPNADQLNSDSDPHGDACDNCPDLSNEDLADGDGDGRGNACDNCWKIYNPEQQDSQQNCPFPPYGMDPLCGDACEDSDSDGDSIGDMNDNCPDFNNPGQDDNDGDGIGNACDNCWTVFNPDQLDAGGSCPPQPYMADPLCGDACNAQATCGNGVREGDEACDGMDLGGESCLSQGYPEGGTLLCHNDCSDFDASGCVTDDGDGDGTADEADNCPGIANPDQANTDSDSHGDACDNCPLYGNEDQLDIDGDGAGNVCDNCLMVFNPNQLDSNRDCYPPPYRLDPVCGDVCESPHELAMSALLGSTALEHEALENMFVGDSEELQVLISGANAQTDLVVTALVDAWECGELSAVTAGEIWKGRLSLVTAQKLNVLAIRMLNHDKPWRRRSAHALVQLALHCKEYVTELLER